MRIVLEDAEFVVPRGSRETTWFVRVRDAWVAAHAVEGAEVERLEAGPGTVWRQSIVLDLPAGTRFLRVETAPNSQRKTPLEYLARGPTQARTVLRHEFRLTAEGQLAKYAETRPATPKRPKMGK
ncbi:MAG: hypothetical protein ACOY0T_06005 [Myxococcota bacterium]